MCIFCSPSDLKTFRHMESIQPTLNAISANSMCTSTLHRAALGLAWEKSAIFLFWISRQNDRPGRPMQSTIDLQLIMFDWTPFAALCLKIVSWMQWRLLDASNDILRCCSIGVLISLKPLKHNEVQFEWNANFARFFFGLDTSSALVDHALMVVVNHSVSRVKCCVSTFRHQPVNYHTMSNEDQSSAHLLCHLFVTFNAIESTVVFCFIYTHLLIRRKLAYDYLAKLPKDRLSRLHTRPGWTSKYIWCSRNAIWQVIP